MAGEEIRLVLPAQSRYVDVAVATMEALADRSGIDADGVAAIRAQVYEVLGERVSRCAGDSVVLLLRGRRRLLGRALGGRHLVGADVTARQQMRRPARPWRRAAPRG